VELKEIVEEVNGIVYEYVPRLASKLGIQLGAADFGEVRKVLDRVEQELGRARWGSDIEELKAEKEKMASRQMEMSKALKELADDLKY